MKRTELKRTRGLKKGKAKGYNTTINPLSREKQVQIIQERELKVKLFERQKGKCVVCEGTCDWRGWHLHHVVFRSQGGKSDKSNCVLVCAGCHALYHGIREVNNG